MTAPVSPSQPNLVDTLRSHLVTFSTMDAAADHIESLELSVASVAFAMGWTDLKGMSVEEYAASLKSRVEQAERTVDVLESALREIEAKTDGDRPTVNPQNAFEHWGELNAALVIIRGLASATLNREAGQ